MSLELLELEKLTLKKDVREIGRADVQLEEYFRGKIEVNPDLTRVLVSFQGNKKESGFRWFKYKEGFSSALVNYCFDKCGIASGRVLDPFAGSGATLFTASQRGLASLGIELLPVGCEIITARKAAYQKTRKVSGIIKEWTNNKPWGKQGQKSINFEHIRITEGAFPKKTEGVIEKYLGALLQVKDKDCKVILRLALLSVLEEVSFTRKDGQYLRWDYRSGRQQGAKKFDKGTIKDFDSAIISKLTQILEDISGNNDLFALTQRNSSQGSVEVVCGSCIEDLPKVSSNNFDAIMTSPPYCNRYDYTRTYALELALLGIDEDYIRKLRQTMLSCTVENKEKSDLEKSYDHNALVKGARIFRSQSLLMQICDHLENLKREGLLNNPGIARMVKNYFWELLLVLMECHRVLKPNAPLIMVNDNVRYAGISIPVDLILSHIAEDIGFDVEAIWVLPSGKGNSSQQMGIHGREELRKCVYVWRALK